MCDTNMVPPPADSTKSKSGKIFRLDEKLTVDRFQSTVSVIIKSHSIISGSVRVEGPLAIAKTVRWAV